MIAPPTFASIDEYVSRLGDIVFWGPHVTEILERHDLAGAGREPVAGFNATYPTFLYGDVVVKLFGHFGPWRRSHASERAAHALIATDPDIAAPGLLGDGQLYDDRDAPWPYLITTRMSGVASWRAELSAEQRLSVAAELGAQIRRRSMTTSYGSSRSIASSSTAIFAPTTCSSRTAASPGSSTGAMRW